MSTPAIRTREVKGNGLTFMVDEAGEGDSVALCLSRGQSLLREKELLSDLTAGAQPAVALEGVIDEVAGSGDAEYRADEDSRSPAHLVQHKHG